MVFAKCREERRHYGWHHYLQTVCVCLYTFMCVHMCTCVNMCVDVYIFANVYVSWCVTGLIKPNTTNCKGGFMIGQKQKEIIRII